MADDVLYDLRDGVATLTLNRPDRLNAQNVEMFEAMLARLEHIAHDDEVHVVVLTGTGRGFCAGGDLSQMAEQSGPPKPLTTRVGAELRHLTRTSQLLHQMPKVTIATVNGACAGGGMSWAMACDLRYAARSAKLTTAFVNARALGDFGMTWFLPASSARPRPRELLLFGDVLTADEAASMGLVNEVFDDDRLLEEVGARAARLVAKAPLALAGLKANLNDAEHLDIAHHLEIESDRLVRIFGSQDTRGGSRAFFEAGPPRFTGR